MNKQITVTGAGGYVGSVLIGALLQAGYSVRAIDRFFFGLEPLRPYSNHPGLRFQVGDIRNVTPHDLEGSWAVVDLAALSNDPTGDLDHELTREINEIGRSSVARAAKSAGVERYVFSSSCSVYGAGGNGHSTESSDLHPLTAYAKSCAVAEESVRKLNGDGFTSVALRLSTVFGLSPRMRFDLVVNLMTLNAFETGQIKVMGGEQWRPLVHVRDVARAILVALEKPSETVGGEVFNVGLTNLQVKDIARMVRDSLPIPSEILTSINGHDHRDYNVNFDRAKEILGFVPNYSIRDGVVEIYDALKEGVVKNDDHTKTVLWYTGLLKNRQLQRHMGFLHPLTWMFAQSAILCA